MSRYRGPKLRITRRLGLLPGLTSKIAKKQNKPGKKDSEERNTKSKARKEYALRLEEKQKLKFNYGLTENQLFRYIKEARRRKGITGLILLQLLEMRLDSICFTLGFANSIRHARQLVNHGHITVNQKVVSIASFQCHLQDIIGVKNKSISKNLIKKNLNLNTKRIKFLPNYLKLNLLKLEGNVKNYSGRDNIILKLDELLVIEYYSRR